MPWNQISRLPPDARKIIELKRVQSILSRRTKHDKPAAIGLNAFLPSTPLAKTGRGQKIMGGAGRKCFPKKSLPKCFNPPSAEYNAQVSIKVNYAFPIWFSSNRAKSGWCWTWNVYLQILSFSPPLHWASYVSYIMFCSHQLVLGNAYFHNGLQEAHICSTKEGKRGDADIGRNQNRAQPACLWDSWGTKYIRDADMGSHQNPKIKLPLYCSPFSIEVLWTN